MVADRNYYQIQIFDITEPLNPQLIETYEWNLISNHFGIRNNILYTSNGFDGISALDLGLLTDSMDDTIPEIKYHIKNYPNPFGASDTRNSFSTTIYFELLNSSQVKVNIYNSKGQKIKRLVNSSMSSGLQKVNWDGCDKAGNKVSSGIYFYDLQVNGKVEAANKCVIIR